MKHLGEEVRLKTMLSCTNVVCSRVDQHSSGELVEPKREFSKLKKRLITWVLLAAALGQVGCFTPIYSSSRDIRARQLIYVSEGFRHIPQIWERIWFLDMPDLATPYRTHGGVI